MSLSLQSISIQSIDLRSTVRVSRILLIMPKWEKCLESTNGSRLSSSLLINLKLQAYYFIASRDRTVENALITSLLAIYRLIDYEVVNKKQPIERPIAVSPNGNDACFLLDWIFDQSPPMMKIVPKSKTVCLMWGIFRWVKTCENEREM